MPIPNGIQAAYIKTSPRLIEFWSMKKVKLSRVYTNQPLNWQIQYNFLFCMIEFIWEVYLPFIPSQAFLAKICLDPADLFTEMLL